MKRLFLSTLILLMVTSVGYAQKSNISKAKNKALSVETPDYQGAKDAINEALENPETKGQLNTLYTAGLVYEKAADAEFIKGASSDAVALGKDALKAYEYYNEAYTLDQLPNAKGKVKPKYTNKIRTSMQSLYRQFYLVNYAIKHYENENWSEAINAFEKHLNILDLPYVAGDKATPAKDSTYYQIMYYTAVAAWTGSSDQPELLDKAVSLFSNLKDKGYEENAVYQSLCQIYQANKDTANFLATLEEGIEKFPKEFSSLGTLINHSVFITPADKATMYLNQAIEKDPNNPQFFNVRGSMLELQGDIKGAMENFDKALAINPDLTDAIINKARLYYNNAIKMEAAAYDQKDLKLQDQAIKIAHDEFKKAIPLLERAIELNPDDVEPMKTLRGLYYRFLDSDSSYQKKYNDINALIKTM